jgi:cytochrome P450
MAVLSVIANPNTPLLIPGLAIAAILYFALLHPLLVYLIDPKGLRKFPSPAAGLAGITNWWLFYTQKLNSRTKFVHAAHKELGPVVRIQPNHVSFTDPRAIADIYSFQSGMMKDPFYETFSGEDQYGVNERSIVNTRDRAVHARKRKFLSSAFALKSIVGVDPIVHTVILKMINRFDAFATSPPKDVDGAPRQGTIDLYRWVNFFTYDAIGEIAFGHSFKMLDTGSDLATAETGDGKQYKTHIIPTFHGSSAYDVLVGIWPSLIHTLKKTTFFLQGNKNGGIFMDVCNFKVRERMRDGKPDGFRDFFENFVSDKRSEKEHGLEYSEILRESNIMIAAGNDTSATAITNVLFLLLQTPRTLQKLREELDPLVPEDGAFAYDDVKDLKYLKACLDEGMRRRPPVAMGLPREVPKGGATIAGHFVPEGTTVSAPAYTIQHDESIFEDPFEFKPERWLEAEGEKKRRMMEAFIPFS